MYYSSHFNSPIGVGIMSNENQTALLPALVVFNDSFKVVRKDYFGINADQRYNGGDVEEPISRTGQWRQYLYSNDSISAIWRKFALISGYRSIFYYQVWQRAQSSVDHYRYRISRWHVPWLGAGYLSGVSVSSSGSVFITGHYAGPTRWRRHLRNTATC